MFTFTKRVSPSNPISNKKQINRQIAVNVTILNSTFKRFIMREHLRVSVFVLLLAIVEIYGKVQYIDLTHSFNKNTPKWPGRESTIDIEYEGYYPSGYWGASRKFCTSEHTSTHIDAPFHVNKEGVKLDGVPLSDLLDVPGVMIDIYDKVHSYDKEGVLHINDDYELTREDLLQWEAIYGEIPPRALVLLRTGWGARWHDEKLYRGVKDSESDANTTKLHFSSADAARFLVSERVIVGTGIDTLSIDPGRATPLIAHHIFGARGKYMLEMVANLHLLPPRGFQLWAVPFKIDDGTGAPTRLLALLNDDDKLERSK